MAQAECIGVFDSGVGGLTVARELMREMPGERIVYLGDTARVPYGTRSRETVRRYAADGAWFFRDRGVKMLIVACNTVSALALDVVEYVAKVPVLGVIGPGALAAASVTRGRIGVIGTEATVGSGAYQRELLRLDPGLEISARACPLFVPLAEEGWTSGEVPELVARRYLEGLIEGGVDTLVLGCTHYPLLRGVLARVAGPEIQLIDSARETARAARQRLESLGLAEGAGNEGAGSGEPPVHEYYVTDGPEKFARVAGGFLEAEVGGRVEKVTLEVYDEG